MSGGPDRYCIHGNNFWTCRWASCQKRRRIVKKLAATEAASVPAVLPKEEA